MPKPKTEKVSFKKMKGFGLPFEGFRPEVVNHPEKEGVRLVVGLSPRGEVRGVLGKYAHTGKEHYHYIPLSEAERIRLCEILEAKRKSQ